ncbi:MAG: lysophospholipid acyltransferase family protein [Betaproteobacteria bacterium]|nr:lysophospholipid acyltransferase family protein [Betaproteobacteria bacterium]
MILLFKILARLPLPFLRLMGLILGWVIWGCSGRYRAMAREALALAVRGGPLSGAASRISQIERQAIGHAGLLVTELPAIWCDPHRAQQVKVVGLDPVLRALDAGRGAILLTPHLGAFELSPRAFAIHRPITVLYRPARQRLLRNMMEALRPTQNLLTAPADASGVRMLLRALRRGEAIGMLPDQVPAQGEGLWAPFFSRPAYTMVLPIRLAQTTGAPIFWALTLRTYDGWRIEIEQWKPSFDLSNAPLAEAVAGMNQALESQIERAPEQYLWAYNRFKVPRGVSAPD